MRLIGANGLATTGSMLSHDWRKPFNISIGLHVFVLALAMLAPTLFDREPKLPEIYTVNLFTATEVAEPAQKAASEPAPKEAEKPAARKIEPQTPKAEVSIQPSKPEIEPAVESLIANPVSLLPLKQKIKIGKTKEEEALDRAKLDKVKQQLQASAVQKQARQAADLAKKDAVRKLADYINSSVASATGHDAPAEGKTSTSAKSAGISGPRGTGVEPDFYMKQYLSTVYQKIHDHWVLPDLQNWDNSLEAVLVITIRKDGTVTNSYFERKSDNIYFNQFVLKSVKDAAPLPPFPDQLTENTFEIGLRFKPGELY